MPQFGLLTNPSNEILREIKNTLILDFDYVEIAMEGPEGNPEIIIDKQFAILRLLKKFKHKPIGHTVPWMDLGSDYEYIRQAWILESMRNIRTATQLGIGLINFHTHLNGAMFRGEKRKILLDNWIKSLREIVKYADSHKVRVMLENVPVSKGIHKLEEFKYLIDNVDGLFVHLDIPHAFTSGGTQAIIEYIRVFGNKISHIHWHDNNGTRDEHLPVGLGLIDHQRVVKELKSMNYDRTITIEVFTSPADAKSSAHALKNLWGEN